MVTVIPVPVRWKQARVVLPGRLGQRVLQQILGRMLLTSQHISEADQFRWTAAAPRMAARLRLSSAIKSAVMSS
jgi:hypothetical protein